jgi:hypothetical protein
VDAILAHGRAGSSEPLCSVLAISVTASSGGDFHTQLSLDSGIRVLASMMSTRGADKRCALRLAQGDLLVCAMDGASIDTLISEASAASSSRPLQSFAFAFDPINTSLELQARVRTMVDGLTVKSMNSVRLRG